MNSYEGARITLENVTNEKDIRVVVDGGLDFSAHIQNQVNKANRIAGLIRRSFVYLDNPTFILLFKALVKPHLEYANSVWCPYKKADITSLENV